MKTKRKFEFLIVIISVIVILLVFFLVVLSLTTIFLHFKQGNVKTVVNDVYDYQYYQRDLKRNHSSFGVVQLFEVIEDEDYLTYVDNNGNHVLISNFGSEEFQCTGVCYCQSKRRGSSIASRGVLQLVAAVSVATAIGTAQNAFNKQCEGEEHYTSCSSGEVFAEVEKCESVLGLFSSSSEAKKIDDDDGGGTDGGPNLGDDEDDKQDMANYYCYGNCKLYTHQTPTVNEFWGKNEVDNFHCGAITLQNEVNVVSLPVVDKNSQVYALEVAKAVFMDELSPFCENQSKIRIDTGLTLEMTPKHIVKGVIERTACQGSSNSIKCRRVN